MSLLVWNGKTTSHM